MPRRTVKIGTGDFEVISIMPPPPPRSEVDLLLGGALEKYGTPFSYDGACDDDEAGPDRITVPVHFRYRDYNLAVGENEDARRRSLYQHAGLLPDRPESKALFEGMVIAKFGGFPFDTGLSQFHRVVQFKARLTAEYFWIKLMGRLDFLYLYVGIPHEMRYSIEFEEVCPGAVLPEAPPDREGRLMPSKDLTRDVMTEWFQDYREYAETTVRRLEERINRLRENREATDGRIEELGNLPLPEGD